MDRPRYAYEMDDALVNRLGVDLFLRGLRDRHVAELLGLLKTRIGW